MAKQTKTKQKKYLDYLNGRAKKLAKEKKAALELKQAAERKYLESPSEANLIEMEKTEKAFQKIKIASNKVHTKLNYLQQEGRRQQ